MLIPITRVVSTGRCNLRWQFIASDRAASRPKIRPRMPPFS